MPTEAVLGNYSYTQWISLVQTNKKRWLTIFKASVDYINKATEVKDLKKRPLEEIVPNQYHEFLPLFCKIIADQVPPHRPSIEHEVRLKDGEWPTGGLLYSMLRTELLVLK